MSLCGTDQDKHRVIQRLHRIEGQVRGLAAMVEQDKDCIEVLRQMKELRGDLPIILSSAYHEYKQDFGSWASEAYVVKSANMDELKATIRSHLS